MSIKGISNLVISTGPNIAGVDEAGRGPLAGPVVAAAVVLAETNTIAGLNDSKKLSPASRSYLATIIKRDAVCWSIASATNKEIDDINVLQASLLAMKRAIEGLSHPIRKILVDGTHLPEVSCAGEAVVKGDSKVDSIAAASILAKVARDEIMMEMDKRYPAYGFCRHKGYPTKLHLDALRSYGVLPIHRLSFAPVKQLIMPVSQQA